MEEVNVSRRLTIGVKVAIDADALDGDEDYSLFGISSSVKPP